MPYRLRRVVGINIRNPRDEGPSLRIAELDTRGAVIAAGRNGVGKTSFLRLIPLFYGATPTRVLRGSGLTTMIRYMLPHASSAVAYEYERTSPEDLRCVVMHCRPDEDAPQFHILRGGFEERFFYDSSGTFVTREEFKARVEGFGIPVEQKLTLSEYRSVILIEKPTSKNASVLRNLAAAHSLGPTGTTLQGLDHIAAAMGNEKISFRDLQDIVVERITSSISDEGGRHTSREIKKGARDVTSWLTDLQHLRDLKAKEGSAKELAAACVAIQKADQSLREFRSAVRDLLHSTQEDQKRLRNDISRAEVEGAQEAERLSYATEAGRTSRDEAKQRLEEAAQTIRATQDRHRHFDVIGIQELVHEADQESQLQADQRTLQSELGRLSAVAQGVESTFAVKLNALTMEINSEVTRLAHERDAARDEESASLDGIDIAEDAALKSLQAPPRLLALPTKIGEQQQQLGELRAQQRDPKATAKTHKDLETAGQQLQKARGAEREARKVADAAREEERAASAAREGALAVHVTAGQVVTGLKRERSEVEAQMKPPEDSLHEFLRASRSEAMAEVAKVISPTLLTRTDLAPMEVPEAAGLPTGRVAVGCVHIGVHAVELPSWFDLRDVQAKKVRVERQLETAEEAQKKASQELRNASTKLEQIVAAVALKANGLVNRAGDVESLERREGDLKKVRDTELEQERDRLGTALKAAEAKIQELQAEQAQLEKEHGEARQRLRADFAQQRGGVKQRKADTLVRIKKAEAALRTREDEAKVGLEAERRQGLRVAGVDPNQVEEMEGRLGAIQARLNKVATNRHEVTSWKAFVVGPLAGLEVDREHERRAKAGYATARTNFEAFERAHEQHAGDLREAVRLLRAQLDFKEHDGTRLQALLDQQLAGIMDTVTGHTLRQWSVDEIAAEVAGKWSELNKVSGQAESLYQQLRSLMRRYDGQVSDWLTQAEAALPSFEGLTDHEAKRQRGLMICQWFERDYVPAVNSLHQDLSGILSLAATFVRDMDLFERQVGSFNLGLQKALKTVSGFDNFRDLTVEVRSSVSKLDYLKTLHQMQEMSYSKVSLMRGSSLHSAREMELPGIDVDPVIRSFRDLLQREGGISVNLADQIRLECSLTINKSRVVISNEEEFKARASNGNSALIVAMFLMGFAQMVRKDSPVRITWVTDEIGRFDSGNVAAFLETLNTNHIDIISAAPQADPSMLYLFDRHCIFRKDGSIWEEREAQELLHAH